MPVLAVPPLPWPLSPLSHSWARGQCWARQSKCKVWDPSVAAELRAQGMHREDVEEE